MYYEFKKLYIKQKWLLLLLLFVSLKIISVCLSGYDSYYTIDIYEESYEKYMNQYSGQLTDDLGKLIQREYYNVNHADTKMSELNQKLEEGTLDLGEYQEKYNKLYQYKQNKDIFTMIYSQYKYALENPKEHYILDSRGWETLLSQDKGDYLLLFGVIIVTTLIFCYEYDSNMELILLTNRKGKYWTGMLKLLTAVISAVSMTIIFKLIECFYLMYSVGLKHGDYPLQSIEVFKDTSYNISLWKGYLFICLLQIVGVVLLVLFISLFALLFKKKVATFIGGGAFVILPMAVFMGKSSLYHLPLPYGFLKGTGYLLGNKFAYRYNTEGINVRYCSFEAVAKGQLVWILIFALIEVLVLGLLCMAVYSKFSVKSIRKNKICGNINKLSIFILSIILIGTMCSGCSNSYNKNKKDYVYNSKDRYDNFDYKNNEIYLEGSENNIMFESKDGTITSLNRDIYQKDNSNIVSICIYRNSCYYMSVDEQNICRIYRISLIDYHKNLLYISESENSEDFFGIFGEEEIDSDWYAKQVLEYSYFFVNEDNIYIVENNSLVRIDRNFGISHTVIKDLGDKKEICYFDGRIYYVSMQGNLKIYNEKDKVIELTNIYGKDISISDGMLKYSDIVGKNKTLELRN